MRRAVLHTDHGESATARAIARSVAPDNTPEMETQADGTAVVTTIERETTGGLHATVDDYVVNLHVAAQLANRPADDPGADASGASTATPDGSADAAADSADPTADAPGNATDSNYE